MMDWATEVAAQLWCKPEHSKKVMDVEFCESIVEALRKAKADGMREAADLMQAYEAGHTVAMNACVSPLILARADIIEKGST